MCTIRNVVKKGIRQSVRINRYYAGGGELKMT